MKIHKQPSGVVVACFAAAMLVLSACSPSGSSASKDEKGPLVIGAAVGLTGVLKDYDGPVLDVVKYSIDQLNAKGGIDGRQVDLKVLDTKSDVARGGQVAQQLIDDGAKIMIVSKDFDFGSPAASVAQKNGMVSISLGAASPKFGVQGIGDKAYSFAPSAGNAGTVLATFCKENGYTKAFTLLDDTLSYTRGVNSAFTKFFTNGGGTVVGTDTFKNDDSSIAVQINKIKAAAPDVLFLASYPPGGASALRQIRAAGIDIPILSGDPFDGTSWNSAVPDLNNFYHTATVSSYKDDADPAVNEWLDKYSKTTGTTLTNGGGPVVGDTIVQALKLAIEKTGSTDGAKIAAVWNTFTDQPFLTGTVTFTPQAHIPLNSPLRIIKYTNGKPGYIKTVTPSVPASITDGIG
ncbi:ABC transporter substrate-binding protein [Arthrobacter sp. MI7-26]|uniref:ABC transporter substrate-binding protein n=1 Tax=Arthrobacter sp. MI7-26 TaxID=2993653 RepID=UPI002248F7C0|nr:ABC transporter substrate-binding protein [Arthrobacter sp. MI7-26]MCX2750046.1 ABC transporter substrate-binding protein [Arthrobacter sp. MI7-26]MCX2750062.1 ABC transporter substrate-binding protein [Arthrobacter sp. MI7-26]